jgi:hypothetical protein
VVAAAGVVVEAFIAAAAGAIAAVAGVAAMATMVAESSLVDPVAGGTPTASASAGTIDICLIGVT